jgi:hypothetical protein
MSYLEFQDSCVELYFTGGLIRRIRGGALHLLMAVSLGAVAVAQTAEHAIPPHANAHPEMRRPSSLDAVESLSPNTDQGPGPGPIGPGPGCNLFPAPPSVGASVGLSYFGPPPAESNPSRISPADVYGNVVRSRHNKTYSNSPN